MPCFYIVPLNSQDEKGLQNISKSHYLNAAMYYLTVCSISVSDNVCVGIGTYSNSNLYRTLVRYLPPTAVSQHCPSGKTHHRRYLGHFRLCSTSGILFFGGGKMAAKYDSLLFLLSSTYEPGSHGSISGNTDGAAVLPANHSHGHNLYTHRNCTDEWTDPR